MDDIVPNGKTSQKIDYHALADAFGAPPAGISPAVWFAIIMQLINVIKAIISAARNEPQTV